MQRDDGSDDKDWKQQLSDYWNTVKPADNAPSTEDSSAPKDQSFLSSMGDKLQARLQHQADLTKATTDQLWDRVKMSNPNMQGPRLPDVTPEEKEQYNNMLGAVAGSVQPLAGAEAFAAKVPASAQELALQAQRLAKPAATQAELALQQQAQNRARDFAVRQALQSGKLGSIIKK